MQSPFFCNIKTQERCRVLPHFSVKTALLVINNQLVDACTVTCVFSHNNTPYLGILTSHCFKMMTVKLLRNGSGLHCLGSMESPNGHI